MFDSKLYLWAVLVLAFMLATAGAESQKQTKAAMPAAKPATFKTQVDYINPNAPPVAIPPYRGERYEARVPDTLDIAERAKLAIHGLTSPLDAEDGYSLWSRTSYANYPGGIARKESFLHLRAKFMEALPLLRIITGSNLNDHVDPVWMNNLAAPDRAGWIDLPGHQGGGRTVFLTR